MTQNGHHLQVAPQPPLDGDLWKRSSAYSGSFWVTCRGSQWDHTQSPTFSLKEKKKSMNFLRNHTLGSLHRARNPSPAQSPFWNLKWADQANMDELASLWPSLPLSSFRHKQGHGFRTWISQNILPGSQHVRKAAVGSWKKIQETSSSRDPVPFWSYHAVT